MKTTTLIFVLFFVSALFDCGASAQEISPILVSKPGKIYLHNGDVLDYQRIEKKEAMFEYMEPGNNEMKQLKIAEVSEVFQQQGSYAVEYALAGALGGLLGAVLGTLSWNEDEALKDSKGPMIIGGTIGGALIGGISGVFAKKNKLVFSSENDAISFTPTLKIFNGGFSDHSRNFEVGLAIIF